MPGLAGATAAPCCLQPKLLDCLGFKPEPEIIMLAAIQWGSLRMQQRLVLTSSLSPGCSTKKGRHGKNYTEEMEDAELLRDEDEDGEAAGHRLTVQPSVITGQMREYQMQGLNWLIHLYDNGINGILADEMVCKRSF